jgi:glyoxylase-like metal-dependent hydrolase (beta-lactamase superfamily II)
MRELRPGLWHWQAPHPDWSPEERWPQVVSACAIDDGTHLLLVDPLAVPARLLEAAEEREPAIVLTAPWHERDARSLAERLDAPVFTPPADSAADLMRKFGITLEQAGDGSPDLEWLRAGEAEGHFFAPGERLPFGVEAYLGREENDLVLWVEAAGAVISGDTLVDFGQGFGINPSLRGGVTREDVVERLRPLLDLPVQVVLTAHGAPTDRAALERALS